MTERQIDENKLRTALRKILIPKLAEQVIQQSLVTPSDPPPKVATPEALERARERGRLAARRPHKPRASKG